ncbi:MAG: phage major capsid protein, partial [Rhodobacteraceae bacterium]|nr:phage major capsid protein [Paracoccaceae bacterium]
MPFNNLISRTDTDALIPETVSRTIIQHVPEQSAVLNLARRLPNMTTNQRRMPVLSILPTAYFVDGDTGLKQTTEVNWANKYLNAEEIACIVPIPESVLDDADYPIWSEVRPLVEEAIAVTIDAAILHGTNA